MTTAPGTEPIGPGLAPTPARTLATRPISRLVAVLGNHSIVDFFSFVGISLLPLLVAEIGLSRQQKALLLGVGSVTSGLIQPAVAWLSDRWDTRALSTAGFVLAVVCVSNLGHAQNFWQLLVLHGLGAAGIGAFHPPAAAVTGQLAGRRRALGMGLFFVLGMAGGFTGNVATPMLVGAVSEHAPVGSDPERFGLQNLSWLMIPGLLACVVLAVAIHSVPHRRHDAHDHHTSLPDGERKRRWRAVWLLYACNVIRFSVNMALVYLFSEWAEQLTMQRMGLTELTEAAGVEASKINGPLQGAMQVGMGGMGLVLGAVLAVRREKLAFVGFPMLGAVFIAGVPLLSGVSESMMVPAALGLSVLSGVGFGSVIPVSMTAAQRLLPHRTSLASGLMLGGAWAFAFIGPQWAERAQELISLDAAFFVTAAILFLAGLLSLAIPGRLLIETDQHEQSAHTDR